MAELRAIAKKVKIKNILNASQIKENENSSFLINKDKILRVNLIATIINDPVIFNSYCQILVDDGSGQINIRNFDDKKFFENVSIGDLILIIGKPRQYNNERYVIGEIIKKIENKKWSEVRTIELKEFNFAENEEKKQEEISQENDYNEVLLMIADMDSGDGIEFEKLVNEKKIDPKILNYLLEKGEIFFIKPGRIKILE